MAITAQQVKELREQTGAGMMDCKKALAETNGDFEAATKLLKEKGLAAVAKRAERVTSEGRIFIRQNGSKIAIVELVCETDFVANNEEFIKSGEKILDEVFAKGYTQVEDGLKNILTDFATKTRENMSVSKVQVIDVPASAVAGIYVHSNFKQAAVTIVKGSEDDKVKEFARDCCMHLVADAAKEKILEGKIKKHLSEVCFVDQMFVKDDKKTVEAKLAEVGNSVGAKLEFGDIALLQLGK